MEKRFTDQAAIGAVKRTKEGYVTAFARAVRSGVQNYSGAELGFNDRAMLRVMRPELEVFAKDSVKSFSHAPVTIGHPKEMVDANNWAELAVGEVGEGVLRDGEYLAVSLMLKDAKAIDAFDGGMVELSAGYTAEIELVDNNTEYDAIMRNIQINHLAMVPKGRAGEKARIGDASNWGVAPLTTEKGPEMEMKAVAIGDKAFNVKADDADALLKTVTDMQSAIGELKAKLADAESKILTDEQIKEKAKAIADGIVKREAVIAEFGDEAVEGASDAEIAGMYRVIGDVKDDTARKALGDAKKESKGEMSELEKFYAEKEAKGKK